MEGGWEEAPPGVSASTSSPAASAVKAPAPPGVLGTAYPDLSFRITESLRTGFILRPQDEETAILLARLARVVPFGISLGEVEVETRVVVLRYPLGFSLEPILGDPRVAFARKCTYNSGRGRREPTHQVEVTFRGQLPNSLDLGS